MPFILASPQDPVDDRGRRVFRISRSQVGYQDGGVTAEVDVEFASAKFGALVTIYRTSLRMAGSTEQLPQESDVLLAIIEGMSAMGVAVEVE
jgi:hypothetical protein